MENKGLLVVISGFSGVGKGTVIQMVLDELPTLRFSISCTTRAPRAGEENGVNYYSSRKKSSSARLPRARSWNTPARSPTITAR